MIKMIKEMKADKMLVKVCESRAELGAIAAADVADFDVRGAADDRTAADARTGA